MSTNRMKKSERRKLHSLPTNEVSKVVKQQKQHQGTTEISRKEWRAKYQKRNDSRWGKTGYSDDDFISSMLIRWPFAELLQYSELLVLLLNRRILAPPLNVLPEPVSSLIYYKYPCEYRNTLFASYTFMKKSASFDEACERSLSFCAYYTEIYKEALEHSTHQDALKYCPWLTRHHCAMLKACFMVALSYDARVRHFVFTRHDIHYNHMKTHPPTLPKSKQFIAEMQPLVNQFIESEIDGATLAKHATDLWLEECMFKIE